MFERNTAIMDEMLAEFGLLKNSGIMLFLFYRVMQQEIPNFKVPNDLTENNSDKYFQVNADKVLLPPLSNLTVDHIIKILNFLSVPLDKQKIDRPLIIDSKFYVNILLPRMQENFAEIRAHHRAQLLPFIAASKKICDMNIKKAYHDALERARGISITCHTNNELKDKANSYLFQIESLMNAIFEGNDLEKIVRLSQSLETALKQLKQFLNASPLFAIAFPEFAKGMQTVHQHTSAFLQLQDYHGRYAAQSAEKQFDKLVRKHYLKTDSCHIFIDALFAVAKVPVKSVKYQVSQSKEYPSRLIVDVTLKKPINKEKLIAFLHANGDPFASTDELDLSSADMSLFSGYLTNHLFVKSDEKPKLIFHIDGITLTNVLMPKMLSFIADIKSDQPEFYEYYASRCREDFYIKFRSECFDVVNEVSHQLEELTSSEENLRARLIDLLNELLISLNSHDYDKRKALIVIFNQLYDIALQKPDLCNAVKPLQALHKWDLFNIYCKPYKSSYDMMESSEESAEFKEDAVDQFRKLNEITVADLKSISRK